MTHRHPLLPALLGLVLVSCGDGIVVPALPVATSVTFESAEVSLSYLGESVQITAAVRDQDGAVMTGVELGWTSSNGDVASVSGTGVVTARGNGEAVVSLEADGAAGSVGVVVQQVADSVALSLDAWSFASLQDTLRLSATVLDAGGSAIAQPGIVWASTNESVATISPDGLVTALGNGSAAVTAIAGGVVESVALTVDQIPGVIKSVADSVLFDALGDTLSLDVMVRDGAGYPVADADVFWSSSDESVVTVTAAGGVRSAGPGSATLTATAGLVVHQVSAVVQQTVTDLVAVQDSVVLQNPGDQSALGGSPLDRLGSEVLGADLVWVSDDSSVVSVDSLGVVTAVETGSAWVTVSSGTVSDSVAVRVEPELALAKLDTTAIVGTVRQEISLAARVEDVLGAAYEGATVWWGAAPGSGEITSEVGSESDETGLVGAAWRLGTLAGTQRAFASVETRGRTVTIEFVADARPGEPVNVSLVADSVLLSARGETVFLAPTYADTFGNVTTGSGVVWSSGDTGVVTVASDGLLTGAGSGQTWVHGNLGAGVDSLLVTVAFRGAITITFDDGWVSVFDNAWPVFQEFDLPANVGVYVDAVEGAWPSYMSGGQLDELHSAGWSMVSHTLSHDTLSVLSSGELDYELRMSQAWLDDRGYNGSNVFVAPYHVFEAPARVAVAGYYTAARGTSADAFVPDSLVSWMPDRPYELTGLEAENLPYTTAQGRDLLRAVLQRTVDEGRFVDLFFHKVPPEDVAALREVLTIVADFRDRVLPYHELYPTSARPVF